MKFNGEEILSWKEKIKVAAWEYALLWTLVWVSLFISCLGVVLHVK